MTLDELVENYPLLHHMAEPGSWPAIQQIGLLSTQQLVTELLQKQRKSSVQLHHPEVGSITIRDQGPLREHNLEKLLVGMTIEEWLAVLNDRVFFWLHPARLDKLLSAKLYRKKAHDVIILKARDLLERHRDRVRITAMNTGATTFPGLPERGVGTFMRVEDFPFTERRRGRPLQDAAVELAVIGGVPDIADLVRRVEVRQGNSILEVKFQR